MNINKFTLAAALSIGIMASTAYAGLTQDLTTDPATSTLAACPLSGCPTPVTPQTATCPSCFNQIDSCSCPTGPACPCSAPSPTKCDCPPAPACDCPTPPACAICPSCKDEKHKQQTYAYPNAIYGENQLIGEHSNGLYIGESTTQSSVCGCAAPITSGIPVSETCGCTGAAASLPELNSCCGPASGIPVSRDPAKLDGAGCPVQIHTNSSMEAVKKSLVPFEVSTPTGAAIPLVSAFEDVPSGFWAGCNINKLTENNIIAGYPDRTFKPNLPVSRAEMASFVVKGFNLNDQMSCPQKTFRDVSKNHWANKVINKAVSNGMMAGYPHDLFKPNEPISRAEAFTILAKGIPCQIDECKANEILSQYCDACSVPDWAKIPVAKALQAGATSNAPQPNLIAPNKDANRAEIAAMLENVRVALGYSKVDKITTSDCGCTGSAAYMAKEEVVKLPTLQLNFKDNITAKASHIGDQFAAETTEDVTIDGITFPCGSRVNGKVIEVVRPTKCDQGAIRLSFDSIKNGDCKADLPQQILSAQVNKVKAPNGFVRVVQMPFTWVGGLLGNVGRTVGGAIVTASNAVDNTVQGFGVGTGELLTGQFRAAGRSYQDVGKQIVTAPVDVTRTALSGTMGLFQYTGDELTYLVDPKGMKVSSINPKEKVTIAFGCQTTR